MKKRYIIALASIGILSTLIGCNTENELSDTTSNNNSEILTDTLESMPSAEFPEHYEYQSEKVYVDLSPEVFEHTPLMEGSAEFIDLDYEAIGRTLMKEEYTQLANQLRGEDEAYGWNSNFHSFGYIGSIETSLDIGACLWTEEKNPDYNLDAYTTPCDFAFASEGEALQAVKLQLEEIGIVLDDTWIIDTYYLDHNVLQQEEYHMNMTGEEALDEYKTDWSEADDSYLFFFSPTYCGIPYQYYNFMYMGWRGTGSAPLAVYYNASGVWKIDCNQIFYIESGKKKVQVMEFEDAISPLIKRYENVLDNTVYEITSARFFWRIEGEEGKIELQPVWAFRVQATTEEGSITYAETQINAETGEIIQ